MSTTSSQSTFSNAYVSCDQPSASEIGVEILRQGGNAADAAIAMAAAVSVLQPMTCGLGGDCNCIFYRASDSSISSINGSGHSAETLTVQAVKDAGFTREASKRGAKHGIFITVPGAVAGMYNCVKHFGSGNVTMPDILGPAIKLAEKGAELGIETAAAWKRGFSNIENSENRDDLLMGSNYPPAAGSKLYSPKLADCMKTLSDKGQEEFYMGDIASRIINSVQKAGGLLTLDDMKYHYNYACKSLPETPLFVEFHGYKIWEMAPNTTGIVVLVALKILEGFDLKALGHNSAEYIHLVSETINRSFFDCWRYLSDPDFSSLSWKHLLTEEYAQEARKHINLDKHSDIPFMCSELHSYGNTSYVTAVDASGNACSFIFSVCSLFGSGNIPEDSGFVLHDRGKYFSLNESSRNAYGPRKRCLHTIIPSLVTDAVTGEVVATLGVIGLWMQPQGHIQVLMNMLIFGMDPQMALKKPRFCVGNPNSSLDFLKTDILYLEDGILPSVASSLGTKGHNVQQVLDSNKYLFGRGHIIAKQRLWSRESPSESNALWLGAADPRWDGIALGF